MSDHQHPCIQIPRQGVVGSAKLTAIIPAIGNPVQRGTGGMNDHHT